MFDHKNHKRLWDWLSKNPEKEKVDWQEWSHNGGSIRPIMNSCFACESVGTDIVGDPLCRECPFDWGTEECTDISSPFRKWNDTKNIIIRELYAKKVRDLPLKKQQSTSTKETDSMIRPQHEPITITFEGNKTIASQSGKTAIAKCNPRDAFDASIGAKVAIERLTKPEFAPYLLSKTNGEKVGEIGEQTNLCDALGNRLKIGDTVLLVKRGRENTVKERVVGKIKGIVFTGGYDEGAFTNGICYNYLIVKNRSFDDIPHGEEVFRTKYIKESV